MNETRPEVVGQVESVMRAKLSSVIAQEYAAAGGVKSLADILNNSDRTTEKNVLKEVDQKDLAIALRGVPDEVASKIFSNMSERGAELLREEIQFQPPQRKRV